MSPAPYGPGAAGVPSFVVTHRRARPHATARPGDGLRTTPKRLGGRDHEVFPEAHAANRRQGMPFAYHLRVGPTRVVITHDGFVLPRARAAEIIARYVAYVAAWRREPRDFPRGGVGYGSFRDFCQLVVRRADAPAWIRLYRDLAAECYDPFQHEHAHAPAETPREEPSR